MKCILASEIDFYDKDIEGNRIPKKFCNTNHILDNLKKYIKNYNNFLYVASDEFNYEITDMYANAVIESIKMTIPFKNYEVLDGRTEDIADELIKEADFILLCGGHVPTQNEFFNKVSLKERIKNTKAFIIGISAGSMNMADDVYSAPELEGESIDPNFKRNLKGLALTDINVLPHYNDTKEAILDEKRFIEDIVLPDTYKRDVYAINDGSYILIDDKKYLYGEAYLLKNGEIKKINDDGQILII